jgi:hypothetical protein
MKLNKISEKGMDNLMDTVRRLNQPPEQIIYYLLENPDVCLEEAKSRGIEEKRSKT